MKKNRRFRFVFILGAMLVTFIFGVAVLKIYDYTLSDAKRTHQLQQMEMVKAATAGISIYLNMLAEDLKLLLSYPGVSVFNPNSVREGTNFLYDHYSDKIIKSVFLLDSSASLIYFKGINPSSIKIDTRGKEKNKYKSVWLSPIEPNVDDDIESGLSFIMLIPLFNSFDAETSIPAGYAGFLVDFDFLIRKYVATLKLSEGDFAWVMDGRGRLIYHPTHSDMLLRSINQVTSDCISCHNSFDVQRRMITAKAGIDEYTISDEPPKIMAYMHLDFGNERWVLAISTFLPKVTESLREKFSLFFGLGVIILIVIISLGALLYFTNAKRIKVEEANKLLEQRQMFQEQLNHAAKLASIGELVDNVAHEINTPLSVISSHVDVLLMHNRNFDIFKEDLNIIKNQTKRINKYTKSLLTYSQRLTFEPLPANIISTIENCLYILSPRVKSKRIRVKKIYKPDLPTLSYDKGQIEQVIINLLNNSIDATDYDGEIEIKVLANLKTKQPDCSEAPEYLMISIKDNGTGISGENIERIFEPFFSTKTGIGTGLGLSISKAIILRHKGKIEVESEPEKFTLFRILLPCNSED